MAERESMKRPIRKLTVRNFSVIKEAELEFGKITVLIGPQASGKSLLCKLAFFLGREVVKIAIDMAVNQRPYTEFRSSVQREFEKWFPKGGWGSEEWSISFIESDYKVTISSPTRIDQSHEIVFSSCPLFEHSYAEQLQETLQNQRKQGFVLAPAIQSRAATKFFKIAGRGVWDASTYIPGQRSYFVDTKKGYRSLAAEADPISAHFADVFANGLKPNSSESRVTRFLHGQIMSWQNEWMFAFQDGRFLPLSDLSSGDKESLPILTTLDYYESQRSQSGNLPSAELYNEKLYGFDDFTIEEPELSVFPKTQYRIVQEIAGLSNKSDFNPHFTITTHSPYILAAFNNLIEASQVASVKPEATEEVARVIGRHFWVKPEDLRAYSINNGTLESIIAEDTGLISTNYLDSVSETIGAEFDELLRLGYVES